ncbi:YfiR family protein [Microbulbifer sp. SAOS-129_SWC]|uniref:YfiR family protein n=1 Tax=Microbulbifer sp. SAOS-129_SWC TaxID=3145235 RepID=UPI0032180EA6
MRHPKSRSILDTLGLALLHLTVLLFVVLATSVQAAPLLSDSAAGRRAMVDYIVHFAHHVQWPIEVFSGTDAPFRICLMGGDELRDPLAERLSHHRVAGREVELERVALGELIRARRCQILVLGEMKRSSLVKAVGALEFFPVLTVSDADRFAATGGIVGFTGYGNHVALQLNKTMLDRAELKMGDSLFRLGRKRH